MGKPKGKTSWKTKSYMGGWDQKDLRGLVGGCRVEWIQLSRGRDHWRAPVDAAMNSRVLAHGFSYILTKINVKQYEV
jgi:hypothetical protein